MNKSQTDEQSAPNAVTSKKENIWPIMARGITGIIIGSAIGHYLCILVSLQGFRGLILPGAITGIACGAISRRRSPILGVISGLVALPVSLFSASIVLSQFSSNDILYFISHLSLLPANTWGLILLGTFFAVWFGIGRNRNRTNLITSHDRS